MGAKGRGFNFYCTRVPLDEDDYDDDTIATAPQPQFAKELPAPSKIQRFKDLQKDQFQRLRRFRSL
jgi:hypothetical protein